MYVRVGPLKLCLIRMQFFYYVVVLNGFEDRKLDLTVSALAYLFTFSYFLANFSDS